MKSANTLRVIKKTSLLFRWQSKYEVVAEKHSLLSEELTLERKTSDILRNELESVQGSRYETSRMESLLQRYEQRVFDLEELEVDLRDRLTVVQHSVASLLYWSFVALASRPPAGRVRLAIAADNHSAAEQEEGDVIEEDNDLEATMMAQLRKERDQLKLMVSQMAADKESLAVSLEGHIDQRIDRVLTLEDKNTRYVLNLKLTIVFKLQYYSKLELSSETNR